MEDTEKYLIHAAITADGVVERSDVVGAIFGQTEGLLGDDLDLRDLQQSSKVGRIDVEIDSQNGQSFGTVTIASTLDRVKTAILAASLETITRVGPCRATVEVTDIEDVREAKRREVVERAKELLSESFDESVMSSTEILDEVKESVRIEDISEYEGLPAGPHVGESDAVVVVEGRADVLTLLRYGVKNAVAVEGTNVPGAVANLTQDRTTTAFLDGDRGGRLILRELAQVGDVDHVAFAPEGRSVEDLERHEVFAALRGKDPIDAVESDPSPPTDDAEGEPPDPHTGSPTTESATPPPGTLDAREYEYDARDGARGTRPGAADSNPPVAGDSEETEASADATLATDDPDGRVPVSNGVDGATASEGSDTPDATDTSDATDTPDATASVEPDTVDDAPENSAGDAGHDASEEATAPDTSHVDNEQVEGDNEQAEGDNERVEGGNEQAEGGNEQVEGDDADGAGVEGARRSLADHVREVVGGKRGTVRLLDDDLAAVAEAPAGDAFDAIADADPAPYAAVLDGEFTQQLLDIAAQRGVNHAVAATTGEFVKKPVGVRLRTADQLAIPN